MYFYEDRFLNLYDVNVMTFYLHSISLALYLCWAREYIRFENQTDLCCPMKSMYLPNLQ